MILVGEESEDLEPPGIFLNRSICDTVINLLGDYRFHTKGYYVSLHAEENNCKVFPVVKNALDAYRAPVFLTRLRKAGFDVPDFEVFSSPNPSRTVLLPLNPFSKNSAKAVKNESQYYKTFKSLSMDYHYPVVHVKIEGVIEDINVHLTRTQNEGNGFAERFFNTFEIPLGKILAERIDDRLRPFYFMPMERKEINLDLIFEVISGEDRLFC